MASKYKYLTTPKGVANYPWLTKPDTKFDEEGEWKVDLVCPLNEETQNFIDAVEAELERHVEVVKLQNGKKPRVEELSYEIDEDEGTVTFKIKMKRFAGKGEKRFEKKIAFFDAAGQPITNPASLTIRPGSEIKVSVRMFTWYVAPKAGLRMEPGAVQVIRLSEGTGGTASAYGFGQEEGYVAPSMENPEGSSAPEPADEEEGEF